jgi:hypothetical protein
MSEVREKTTPSPSVPLHEGVVTSADLIQKIEESVLWSKKVFEEQQRVRRYLLWNTIANFLRLALIIIPIILGLLFLPALLKDATSMFNLEGGVSNPFSEILNLYQS